MNKCKYCDVEISIDRKFCSGACACRNYWELIYGKFKTYEVKCHVCGKRFDVRERSKRFPMKKRYFCGSFCAHSYAGSCGWNKRRKEKQSIRIRKLWRNKEMFEQFKKVTFFDIINRHVLKRKLALLFLLILPVFLVDNSLFDRVGEEYDAWRLEKVFYARSLGITCEREILERIFDYSVRFDQDFNLMLCWCFVESRFTPDAISPVGARGIYQVMPMTARKVVFLVLGDRKDQFGWTVEEKKRMNRGHDLFDLEDNLLIAFTYISMLKKSSRNLDEVLAKYYSGSRYRSYLSHRYVYTIRDLTPIKTRNIYKRL